MTDLKVEERCICQAARKASRYLSAAFDDALSPSGLKATQFTVLHALERFGPSSVSRMAALIGMDRTSLAKNLKPLLREGWIAKAPSDDRRVRNYLISPSGLERYRTALPLWQGIQLQFETAFGPNDTRALHRTLSAVLETGFEPWTEQSRPARAGLD